MFLLEKLAVPEKTSGLMFDIFYIYIYIYIFDIYIYIFDIYLIYIYIYVFLDHINLSFFIDDISTTITVVSPG